MSSDLVSLLDEGVPNITVATRKQCNFFKWELERRVNNGINVSVEQFNAMFHGLNQCCRNVPDHMVTRHTVYQWMIDAEVIPDVRTFNLLIKGIGYTRPLQFKFITYFLNEMSKFNVEWALCTVSGSGQSPIS